MLHSNSWRIYTNYVCSINIFCTVFNFYIILTYVYRVSMKYLFPLIIISLYIGASFVYCCLGDWARAFAFLGWGLGNIGLLFI